MANSIINPMASRIVSSTHIRPLCYLGALCGIPAIVVGVKGMRAADEGRATNKGMSIAGVAMGSIFTAFNVIYVSFLIIYFSMLGI